MGYAGEMGKVMLDVIVGVSTGAIGGLFYQFDGQTQCLSSIFLGTLYWFFYGTRPSHENVGEIFCLTCLYLPHDCVCVCYEWEFQ